MEQERPKRRRGLGAGRQPVRYLDSETRTCNFRRMKVTVHDRIVSLSRRRHLEMSRILNRALELGLDLLEAEEQSTGTIRLDEED